MIHIMGATVVVHRLGKGEGELEGVKVMGVRVREGVSIDMGEGRDVEDLYRDFEHYFREKFCKVGDLSEHPITQVMKELEVRPEEVGWVEPGDMGFRTPYHV